MREFAWQYLLPPNGLVTLALVGALWSALSVPARRAGAWLAVVALAVLGLALTPPVTGRLIGLLEVRAGTPLSVADLRKAMDGAAAPRAIIILGGGMLENGRGALEGAYRIAPRALERVLAGARLARASGLPVLVSGGPTVGGQVSEAELMAAIMADDLGVKARWIEAASMTTADNARESARLLAQANIRHVVLVTHAYHMARARATFEAAGLSVLPAPTAFLSRDGPEHHWLRTGVFDDRLWLALHEFIGMIWYRWRGLLPDRQAPA
ncbi:MAG: YdcF family protein [Burkholderiaceae bacterium]